MIKLLLKFLFSRMRSVRVKWLLIACLSIYAFSCQPEQNKQDILSNVEIEAGRAIALRPAGEVQFRRSYANIQFMEDEKEIDEYILEQDRTPPWLVTDRDSLIKPLEKLGFVKNDGILLDKFPAIKKDETSFTYYADHKNATIKRRLEDGYWKICITTGQDSTSIYFLYNFYDIKFALLDVIPGGNKEVLILEESYIMNGYNYDIYVYEVISLPRQIF